MMTTQLGSEIFNYLKSIGCCNLCCLRFYNGRCDDYLNVEKSLISKGITIDDKRLEADSNETKRFKTNPCVACGGLFENGFLDEVVQQILQFPGIETYHCDSVLTGITLPVSVQFIQLSIWIGLYQEFPDKFSLERPPDVPLKEVLKLMLNPKVCQGLNKKFELNQNGLMVNVSFGYETDLNDFSFLNKVNPEYIKKHKRSERGSITRNAFDKYFNPSTLNLDLFTEHAPKLTDVCQYPMKLQEINVQGPTIFVAGRYRKYSRHLCQSPWILNGKRMMESSLQEIIMDKVIPYFGVSMDKAKFSSSGREDVDVRCLGRGRPFAIELPDSHETVLPRMEAAKMEQAIEKSEQVSISHLQIVKREDINELKSGEEMKQKTYRALCILKEPATVDVMKKLNISEPFTVHQATPLRVLHRRPLCVRDRTIYSVRAFVKEDDHRQLILDIITQAGTYVKELVHGEFDRTLPNLKSICGQWIDIVELDVLDIDLDWPMPIDNQQELNCEIVDEDLINNIIEK